MDLVNFFVDFLCISMDFYDIGGYSADISGGGFINHPGRLYMCIIYIYMYMHMYMYTCTYTYTYVYM